MDKYEYKLRSEEISNLIDKERYAEAVNIADTIDWRRVKSPSMLLKIAALYRVSRRNEDSRAILMLAYDRYPTNRSVVHSLCEVSIELDDVVAAIEYYKQFVKLAPRDNGVFTLRYRILEMQEASLEERIEILEELKKHDYQEEWAYELAYLYHRVGLATKCVEECDEIILWFGEGPYVMKAMELKMLHAPLTEVQQMSYDVMKRGGADDSYAEYGQQENYENGGYAQEGYAGEEGGYDAYGNDAYAQEGYTQDNYGSYGNDGNDGYTQNGYGETAYGNDAYAQEDYAGGAYGNEGYAEGAYGYGQDNYGNGGYAEDAYGNEGYAQEGYAEGAYDNSGYGQDAYGNEGYTQDNYGNEGYTQDNYGNEGYAQDNYGNDGYVDDGYGNLSYVGNTYPETGYTGEFYVEQTYDVNGNPVGMADYNEANAYGAESIAGGSAGSAGYEDSSQGQQVYGEQAAAPKPQASPAAADMSQYNTINLQKVVAESMKEFFPDDDVFAEEREKLNKGSARKSHAQESVAEKVSSDTIIYDRRDILGNAVDPEEPQKADSEIGNLKGGVSKNSFSDIEELNIEEPAELRRVQAAADSPVLEQGFEEPQQYTDKVAQLVTGVSEEAPKPNTGAISKVIIPGEDARFMQADAGMDELRDTTEKTVNEEQIRMARNDENVYQQDFSTDTAHEPVKPMTGQMNLEDVLVEWERMKLDNVKKHEEEIKQHVLTQTGKIFANFDNSVKSGILGELEREEEESRKAENRKASRGAFPGTDSDSKAVKAKPGEESEDEFDVSYMTEGEKAKKLEEETRNEYLSELGRAVVSELNASAAELPQEPLQHSPTQAGELQVQESQDSAYEEEVFQGEDFQDGAYQEEAPQGEEESALMQDYQTQESPIQEYQEETYQTEGYPSGDFIEDTAEMDGMFGQNAEEAELYYEADTQDGGYYGDEEYMGEDPAAYYGDFAEETAEAEGSAGYGEDEYFAADDIEDAESGKVSSRMPEDSDGLDPEDEESIAEMAIEDALRTQEIKMSTADLSSLSEKIVAATKREATGAKREEIRDFTVEEQTLFENFAVTKKIKKQIIYALDNMTLAAYTGNVILTGDAGIDTVRMAKNIIKEYQSLDANFSGKAAKITGAKINQRNLKEIFEKINNGGIIIEKANGMSAEKLYEMASLLNQENLGIIIILEDTKKEITRLLEKQAMIADYFNLRIDLMEMDNNALVAYARNYALALEYSIDELGTLALYTRIANMQSGNHVVTKDEVRDIIDEAIWKSKKSKIKNFVDVLFARRYDDEDMVVLKERDFM